MRIAFYAPLKSPGHATPSGDRRVAALLIEALERAGHRVFLASSFRSYDATGEAARQAALREQGRFAARQLRDTWLGLPRETRPELWFTYHVYHKAPDWIGPEVAAALGIPYVIAEASFAPRRAGGPWAIGHEAAREAIARADLVLAATRHDAACLEPLLAAPERLALLPPFVDPEPFRAAARSRTAHRARLAGAQRLDPQVPWIAVGAMMRHGDKLASYRELAAALALLEDLPWQLVVAGDGPARSEVEAALGALSPARVRLLGLVAPARMAQIFAACDLLAWPAVNEAYGMALLEAQAAGVPVVSCALRGVPEVVVHGRTGLLAPPGEPRALAALLRGLLADPARRAAMGEAAAAFAAGERSIECAAARLRGLLARFGTEAPTQ